MANKSVLILSSVLHKLHNVNKENSGRMLGLKYNDTVIVIGIVLDDDVLKHIPVNLKVIGLLYNTNLEEGSVIEEMRDRGPDCILAINNVSDSSELSMKILNENDLENIDHKLIEMDELGKYFWHFRVKGKLPLSYHIGNFAEVKALAELQKKVEKSNPGFQIPGTEYFVFNDDNQEGTVKTILSTLKRNKFFVGTHFDVITAQLLYSEDSHETVKPVPIINYEKRVSKTVMKTSTPIDFIVIAQNYLKLNDLHELLFQGVIHCINVCEEYMSLDFGKNAKNDIPELEIFHFLPSGCGHFLTIPYPSNQPEDMLRSIRKYFHENVLLDSSRAMIRRANACSFTCESSDSPYLVNPHEGLPPSGVQDGEVCIVQGQYSYHHYMQDNMDDNGWGCAYRSFQTVFSWFKFQGSTNKQVPSIIDIQKCLVKIGDKPQSFIGSRNWIGSTEVSFCLDAMLGVSSRIIAVNSGEDLSMKGGELGYHFKNFGTPIMIGGGQLAHTILGIDYNKKTGALKFLVLDPHYTGSEDLHVIQNKGWCSWKDLSFWKKNCFYNLCLPLYKADI